MEIVIDWEMLKDEESFYNSLLPQLSAPEWHGRNLDALADSIITGTINDVEPPYTITSLNEASVVVGMKGFQVLVLEVLREAEQSGREIHVLSC